MSHLPNERVVRREHMIKLVSTSSANRSCHHLGLSSCTVSCEQYAVSANASQGLWTLETNQMCWSALEGHSVHESARAHASALAIGIATRYRVSPTAHYQWQHRSQKVFATLQKLIRQLTQQERDSRCAWRAKSPEEQTMQRGH